MVRGRVWVTQGWSIVLPPCVQRRWEDGCEWPRDDLSYYHHVYREGERTGVGDPGVIYRITTMCTENVRERVWVTQGWSIVLPPCAQRWWEDGSGWPRDDLSYYHHVYREGERTGVGDPGMIYRITTMCTENVRERVWMTQGWSIVLPPCVQRRWEDGTGWPRDDLSYYHHVCREGERAGVGDPGMIYRITIMCTEKVRGREWVTQGWSIVLPPCVQRRWEGGSGWPRDDLSYYHHVYREGEKTGVGDPGMIYRITTAREDGSQSITWALIQYKDVVLPV